MLDDRLIARYQRDGVVCLRSVIDEHWLGVVAAAIERDIARPGPFYHGYVTGDAEAGDTATGGAEAGETATDSGKIGFHGNLRIWENDEGFRAYCMESPLPDLARQMMGSDRVNLFYDQLFVKNAGTDSPTRWHNDQPYWPVLGRQVISFWLALDPTDLGNGGLEFVAGSHRWDRWFQPESFGRTTASSYERNPDYEPMPDIDAERAHHRILSWDMEPGDVLAFSAMTVHGAPPNRDRTRRRRGYTVRYTGDDAIYHQTIGMSRPLFTDTLANGDPIGGERFPQLI